jgi:hypothetical protein
VADGRDLLGPAGTATSACSLHRFPFFIAPLQFSYRRLIYGLTKGAEGRINIDIPSP